MTEILVLTPAYNRDYNNRVTLLTDFFADKDFIIANYNHPNRGKYINRKQILIGTIVELRYKKNKMAYSFMMGDELTPTEGQKYGVVRY